MIIPAQEIRRRCLEYALVMPFHERTQEAGMSYGLSPAGYDIRIDQDIYVPDGRMVLASSVERFHMPADLLAYVKDKSTWARRGLFVQNTVIEPGWSGYLTLELTYTGPLHVHIKRGAPIAQIVFHLLNEPTEQPYEGKYQDQEAGPVKARLT